MLKNDRPDLLMTTLTGGRSVDIIAPASTMDDNLLKDYLQRQQIGFLIISRKDACHALLHGDCIGRGCYAMYDNNPKIRLHRATEAQARYNELAEIIGFVTVATPIELTLNDMALV
jgi:hypothetical protein